MGVLVGLALAAKAVGLVLALGLVGVAVCLAPVGVESRARGGNAPVGGGRARINRSLRRRGARSSLPRRGVPLAAAVAALLVGGWGLALSLDAGRPVLSSSPGYNAALLAPGVAGAPVLVDGLHEPPSITATTPWEDPAAYPLTGRDGTVVGGARALTTPSGADGLLARVGGNLLALAGLAWQVLLLPLGVAAALVGLAVARDAGQRRRLLLVLAGPLGVVAVVAVSVVEVRYLWPAAVLAAPAPALLLGRLRGRVLPSVVVAGLVMAVAVPLVPGVLLRAGAGEQTRATARQLAELGLQDARVASANRFQRSALVCLHVGCTYLGVPADEPGTAQMAELERSGVQLLLQWQPAADPAPPGAVLVDTLGELSLWRLPAPRADSGKGGTGQPESSEP